MATTTKKDLVERIAEDTKAQRKLVSAVVQSFLDEIIAELGKGNRIEFREFGIFDVHDRPPRMAQNPKTLEKVRVPAKRSAKFKAGKLMKAVINNNNFDDSIESTKQIS